MSTRLELSGFRLEKLRSLFGSGRQEVVDEVEAKLDRALKAGRGLRARLGEEPVAAFKESLRGAIRDGAPLPGLGEEGEPQAQLMDWLAQQGQKHRRTDCDIKAEALRDFRDQYGKALGATGRALLGHLADGRPLLGERFRPGSPIAYGYLTRAEAGKLMAAFERLSERESPPKGDWDEDDFRELASDFIEWLGEIGSKELDVWAFIG